ncbi:MAG: glycosyltransferase family 4 protein [Akkermansiaceae bacterium]
MTKEGIIKPPEGSGMVVFAHVPPPHHGQSQMVELDLALLRARYGGAIHHVDARWSDSLEEIGQHGFRKILRIVRYLIQAIRLRLVTGAAVLYYVPGPAKWSAVVRDIIVLGVLRRFYPYTVFHWHAIGQGEWAHGSERLVISKHRWLDRLMAKMSELVLEGPDLSIVVSSSSDRDARAIRSRETKVVSNGIHDLVGDGQKIPESRQSVHKLLFFSRGSREKGILDALDAVEICGTRNSREPGRYSLTLAGGVEAGLEREVKARIEKCLAAGVKVERHDFINDRDEKSALLSAHDVLIFPSRWESFGLVVVEAMALNLPVVATRSDGVVGVLGADYPYLSGVGDLTGLADSLERCIQDVNGVYQVCWGRSRFEKMFTMSHHEGDFLEVIDGAFHAHLVAKRTDVA